MIIDIDLPLNRNYTAGRSFIEIKWKWLDFKIGIGFDARHSGYSSGWKINKDGGFSKEMYNFSQYPRDLTFYLGFLTITFHWCKIIASIKE